MEAPEPNPLDVPGPQYGAVQLKPEVWEIINFWLDMLSLDQSVPANFAGFVRALVDDCGVTNYVQVASVLFTALAEKHYELERNDS